MEFRKTLWEWSEKIKRFLIKNLQLWAKNPVSKKAIEEEMCTTTSIKSKWISFDWVKLISKNKLI